MGGRATQALDLPPVPSFVPINDDRSQINLGFLRSALGGQRIRNLIPQIVGMPPDPLDIQSSKIIVTPEFDRILYLENGVVALNYSDDITKFVNFKGEEIMSTSTGVFSFYTVYDKDFNSYEYLSLKEYDSVPTRIS